MNNLNFINFNFKWCKSDIISNENSDYLKQLYLFLLLESSFCKSEINNGEERENF